jgi:hypothetical protein
LLSVTQSPPVVARHHSEESLRTALIERLGSGHGTTLQEFSLPGERLRADVVHVVDNGLIGFELKSAADTLTRLPRQLTAYERVCRVCHAFVAPKHLAQARDMLPEWWGLITSENNGSDIQVVRTGRRHGNVQREALVQLLWKAEARRLLDDGTAMLTASTTREELWSLLVARWSTSELETVVAQTLLTRDPSAARLATHWSRTNTVKLHEDMRYVMRCTDTPPH